MLYVSLVNAITTANHWNQIRKRLQSFGENSKIKCLSLPVQSLSREEDKAEQISQWWKNVEQKSIELSLDYGFVIQTDIADCYPGIYTHSIAWALHTKAKAKISRNDSKLIGNIIDDHIVNMQKGQTNGIPQGSVLMDFVAEILLGYADTQLTKKIDYQKITDYEILRYRDDYRVFANSTQEGDRILKSLTEVLMELGLQLSSVKTNLSSEVIQSSIKEEKLNWIYRKQDERNLQKRLLIVHNHSQRFPNAGSLEDALHDYHKHIFKLKEHSVPTLPLIAIITDIMHRSPRTYAVCAAILSKLIDFLDNECKKQTTVERVRRRFSNIPNTGYLEIWLQRFSHKFAPDMEYSESLCKLVYETTFPNIEVDECQRTLRRRNDIQIWNNDWISSVNLKRAVDPTNVVNAEILDEIAPVVAPEEVEVWAVYP